jgi:hypothetical protein
MAAKIRPQVIICGPSVALAGLHTSNVAATLQR